MDYSKYLQSSHWQETRKERLSLCNHCTLCGASINLHVHHKRYTDYETKQSILGKEKMGDLSILCSSCHRLWHLYYGEKYLRHKIASKIRRLIKLGVQVKYAFLFSIQPDAYTKLLNFLKGGERTTHRAQALGNTAPTTPTHPDAETLT
jgi:hypothetical protein